MAVARLPFVIANAVSLYVSFRPPNVTPDSDELNKYKDNKDARDILTPILGIVMPPIHALNTALGLCEVYLLLSTVYPSLHVPELHRFLLPTGTKPLAADDFYLSSGYVAGSILMYASAYLRVLCFRTLGRHFTFELSLRKEHKLITAGPYSIVRHPSYLAATGALLGMIITQLFCHGTWWIESNMWITWQGQLFGAFWIALATFLAGALLSRVPKEDYMLKTEFKGQWTEWAQKTPYTVIPFIW
ncbi:hypothetical protein EUX98_g2498 [Antrodiella citrinella]|uniref:Protein-S-isoprenylcysteine O-methyltransferase n=1 Tax=Antrodiella citrinella TaxID=2447956 RepID=A0A4S4N100_9APHY|nr:hypothetical protein EUX98_g2498 [Antrodiella citrinella]